MSLEPTGHAADVRVGWNGLILLETSEGSKDPRHPMWIDTPAEIDLGGEAGAGNILDLFG